jgi:uncharacterized protein YndB with AHSA1/START domain
MNTPDARTAPHLVECVVDVAAPAATVYALYQDVAGWPRWDPDTAHAALSGPWAVGTRGRLKPRKGLAVTMHLTQVEPNQSFTVECPVLGSRMVFEHTLTPLADGGTRVVHRVRFVGWLAPLLHATVGRDVRSGLPVTLERLKQLAQSLATMPP